jgi:hypothetical protein
MINWKAALTAVGLAAFVAGAITATAHGDESVRFAVKIIATNGFYIDNGDPGPSAGDLFGSEGPVRQDGEQVGRFSSACTATGPLVGQCELTLRLKGRGRIEAAGNVKNPRKRNRISITGGTGEFRGAEGVGKLRRLNQEASKQRIELHLSL